jgi:hypothetical protein
VARLKNRRHEIFAVEVASCAPYDLAYVRAGYPDTPWSGANGRRLAQRPEVVARIAELQAEHKERSAVYVEYLQAKLAPIIEVRATDLFEKQADLFESRERLKPLSKLPPSVSAAIERVKVDPETGRVTDIVLHNKLEAVSLLLRSIGGLTDRHEIDARVGIAEMHLGDIPIEDQRVLIGALQTLRSLKDDSTSGDVIEDEALVSAPDSDDRSER